MSIAEIILTIATTLLGGTNIVQLVNNRALRRKMEAEGEQEEIKSLQLIIDGNKEEISRLQDRVETLEKRYNELVDSYVKLQNELIARQK